MYSQALNRDYLLNRGTFLLTERYFLLNWEKKSLNWEKLFLILIFIL